MNPGIQHDVFISYSSADEAWAQAVLRALEGLGLRCWIAPRDIVAGETWSGAIVAAIQGCRVMVMVFSRRSNDSPQVTRELVQAAERGVHVLPLRIEDVQPSNDKAFYLGAAHWRNVLGGPTEANLAQLCKDVRQILAMPAAATDSQGTEAARLDTSPLRARRWRSTTVAAAVVALLTWCVFGLTNSAPEGPKVAPTVDPTPKGHDVPPMPVKPDSRWNEAPDSLRKSFELLDGDWIETAGRQWPTRTRHVATGIDFVLVPGGRFELGSKSNDLDTRDEQPVRQVRLSPFYVSRCEVSVAQFGSVSNASNLPAVDMTEKQAEDWCTKYGLALPTEAEWEYAASGEKNLLYPWGEAWQTGNCNSAGDEGDGFRELAPIGSFHSKGASWCGAEDMAGNVAEWCRGSYATGYGDHTGDVDPEPPTQFPRCVARGGSWSDRPSGQRTSDRRPYECKAHDPYVGFRCIFKP